MRAPRNAPAVCSGFLLLNKKPGLTSFETLNRIKRCFSTSKVGHTGTLDKFASGLLIALVGRAVKLSPWFTGSVKEYEGVIRLGQETDTLDPEGTVIGEADPPSREALTAALERFRGELWQVPPAYSAVHVGGERASALARQGTAPELKARPVTIETLELRAYEPPAASIAVRCSKGTYIRSLARDIARAAGSRGYLAALTRTAIAGFRVADAVELDGDDEALRRALRPLDRAAFTALGIKPVVLDGAAAAKVLKGAPLSAVLADSPLRYLPCLDGETAGGLFDERGALLSIIEKNSGPGTESSSWRYGYVYARAGER